MKMARKADNQRGGSQLGGYSCHCVELWPLRGAESKKPKAESKGRSPTAQGIALRLRLFCRLAAVMSSSHHYVVLYDFIVDRGLRFAPPTSKFLLPLTRFYLPPAARQNGCLQAVRRHLLCPLFAPRFVSAFFFRARGGAAARRDGGLKGGDAVYAVSAFGLAATAAFRETFLQDASGSRRTAGGPRASATDGAAVCQP